MYRVLGIETLQHDLVRNVGTRHDRNRIQLVVDIHLRIHAGLLQIQLVVIHPSVQALRMREERVRGVKLLDDLRNPDLAVQSFSEASGQVQRDQGQPRLYGEHRPVADFQAGGEGSACQGIEQQCRNQ